MTILRRINFYLLRLIIPAFCGVSCTVCALGLQAQEGTAPQDTLTSAQVKPREIPQFTSAAEAFKSGLLALEKQQFRPAKDAFRWATVLDPVNTTYLHQFAKALFYADGKNRDSMRLANELMNLYSSLGKETSEVQLKKAQVLKTDIENRLEGLLQDSLRIAQRDAARYGADFGYKARLKPPPERKAPDSSLAGQTDWQISMLLAAGLMQQPHGRFDQWASGGVDVRWGAWLPLGDGLDWGVDAALSLRLSGLLEQTSLLSSIDSSFAYRRFYEAGTTIRLRFSPRSTIVFGVLGSVYADNAQGFRIRDNEAWSQFQPFFLAGGGVFLEPRLGLPGIILEGRYYALAFGAATTPSRIISGALGYGFGSAEILAEGMFMQRQNIVSSALPQSLLYARLSLRWHFIQAVNNPQKEVQ
ncbi:MAG: hypothetical protein MUF71_11610 [Candidatus Kapabacteria bacterium]|jgi:hypothetical protein|nr:hypothetical protein [Candidatus Kapabacteria bacterium]